MQPLLQEEILGALDDLGSEVILDSGARITVPFRRDYREADLPDGRIESQRASLTVSSDQIATHKFPKGMGLSVDGDRFTVRRVEPMQPGFSRVVLTDQ